MRPSLLAILSFCALPSCTALYPFGGFSFDGGSSDARTDVAPDAPTVDVAGDAPTVDSTPDASPDVAPDVSLDVAAADVPVDAPMDTPADTALDRPDVATDVPADAPPDRPDVGFDASLCPMGMIRCGAVCVDSQTDRDHCGGCSRPCSVTCSAGVCVTAVAVRAGLGVDTAAHACALLSDHTVRCWGSNDNGQLGDGTLLPHTRPVAVVGLRNVAEIAVGGTHTCALLLDGTVSCWGSGESLQLGDGTAQRSSPSLVMGLTNITQISAGTGHTCVTRSDGAALCWGRNTFGACGVTPPNSVAAPTLVASTGVVARVATGYSHSCAVRTDGAVRCWGAGFGGQLGDGRMLSSSTPVAALGVTASDISAGNEDTCALARDGHVWCWGANHYGALGRGTTNLESSPGMISTLANVTAVSVGSFHACAVVTGASLQCWGYNNVGQIGDQAGLTQRSTPGAVPLIAAPTAVSCGYDFTCAVLATGAVQCWGQNAHGQLGDGSTIARRVPLPVLF